MKIDPNLCAREERPCNAELEAQAKAKREAETQQRINQRVSFGKSNSGKATGNPGSPNGNASSVAPFG